MDVAGLDFSVLLRCRLDIRPAKRALELGKGGLSTGSQTCFDLNVQIEQIGFYYVH